ncbi:N-acetylneuraminate synthase family protein [Methanohalophilus portucalensis]|nr:N-acetylneuraminate synthase family protein [Methanohalophilus portucalensis]ATU08259.1 N-acetylneuraminate synthase [Methanohalophilus portucalensis]RNI13573.1 N-acetylneuraminate synthase [Methanohalophilus portucalensis FDF-1]SMH35349.1 N-acetylneuraminate synthase [Methanohalophilus portucalensis FDF-1]
MNGFNYQKPKVIAEIGCNHKGNFDIALELIDLAKECGADVAKFQKRNPSELLTPEQYNAPHPNPINSYGDTYGEHREYLEFTKEQHAQLKKYCEKKGIEYSTSVWDITSAKEIVSLNPKIIKVPSASNNNFEMLKVLRDEYRGEVHVSFGMTEKQEEENLIAFFEENGSAKSRLVIYACTSGYPVPYEDLCILEINRLYEEYEDRVKEIGFSGHHLGTAVDIACYTLGARWIERHFTKDRTWKGTDHSASLEPRDLSTLVTDLNNTYKALRYKCEDILDIEKVQREKLKHQF